MSQPPSPHSPPPEDDAAPPRRLISPQERFAPQVEPEPAQNPAPSEPENPFDAQISARRRDEMERRHLPPRERARQERARLKRDGAREQAGRDGGNRRRVAAPAHESRMHDNRARAERDFAQTARTAPPAAPPKRRRVPKWMKRLLALVALLFIGQLGFAMLTAPQFGVETVEIQGIVATPTEQLQPLARELVGQNWLRLNGKPVENAVALLPTVASARVIRLAQWPPKVALRIVERKPVLQVGAGDNWWVADAVGVPFRRSTPADDNLYSVVAPQFAPQARRPLDAKLWKRTLALHSALEADNRLAKTSKSAENARFWQLRRIYFDRDGLASLRLNFAPHREMLVRLGDDAYGAKLARARQSLSYFERTKRRASELDLVSLERPVWTQRVVQNSAKPVSDTG